MAKVIIYTTPECAYCKMAKEFFKQNDISYEEKDVSIDDAAREEMIEKSGQLGVPVIAINDKIVVGFDEKELLKCMM
ncbi:MAG: glutaredoxin family protein [Candidatus Azambacteria bacterium]|nr:glutaredoxin family protein [Candidatus Azambacteria bacterium]